ncbi:hypothetical protein ACFU53_27990 [Streptomyces sp. NPDC057474]|uniref:hypothetical protein n=1 Tax=Streptomyces sp. NPDC057474 TaxID=3346144 RepID=UPI0036B95ADE
MPNRRRCCAPSTPPDPSPWAAAPPIRRTTRPGTTSTSATSVGVGNGNPHNVDSFKRPARWTWHGKALVILRPAKRPGRLTLTATSSGLRPATLALPVRRRRS